MKQKTNWRWAQYWLLALAGGWGAGCQSQLPPQAACDPPPLCLPAMKQPFGFCLELAARAAEPAEAGELPWQILADENRASPANHAISLRLVSPEGRCQASFLAPEQLNWLSQDTFQAYLAGDGAQALPLLIKVRTETVDCCPQFAVEEIALDGQKLRRAKGSNCFVLPADRG